MSGLCSAILLITALAVTGGAWTRVGPARALALGIAVPIVTTSALGIALLDLGALRHGPLVLGLLALGVAQLAGVALLRRRLPARPPTPRPAPARVACWLAALVIIALGTWLRAAPSPYLHGGQDQGIYVNVGHHIARTGRLRPVDPLMAGRVRGVRGADIRAAHNVRALAEDSPLRGRSEGRWLAGLHIEHARSGRLVPAFFHLLPTWFAMAELDLGFARSTWPLTLFACLSLVAALGLGLQIGAGCSRGAGPRPLWTWSSGLLAALALTLQPLDLWFSSFPVTENLARASLLGAAWLGIESTRADNQETVAPLLGLLAGAVFSLGVFARGSALALALVLIACSLVTPRTPARGALLLALLLGASLGAAQAIEHSWPYFFHAAHRHFPIPQLTPDPNLAAAIALIAAAALYLLDRALAEFFDEARARAAWLLRPLAAALLLAALAAAALRARAALAGGELGINQQVLVALARHGGAVYVLLGLLGLGLAVRRVAPPLLPWLTLAAAIAALELRSPGVRYEFYYARYHVAALAPALVISATYLINHVTSWARRRGGPRAAALTCGALLVAWIVPPLPQLRAPAFWTRDLERGPTQLRELFALVPDDAVLFFDARAPGRFRDVLATPALLSFGKRVLVYPDIRLVERMVNAGTPVYMLSGGWEPEDRQRWPRAEYGPWYTNVVARGTYLAPRAEIVAGGAPRELVDHGGRWELHELDRSVWRDHGALSLYPGSRFLTRDDAGGIESEPLPLRWAPSARLELALAPEPDTATSECSVDAALDDRRSLPRERTGDPALLRWRMPPPPDDLLALAPTRVTITLDCQGARPRWRRLSVRWEPRARE